MNIEVTAAAPASVEADLLALTTSGARLHDLEMLIVLVVTPWAPMRRP